LIVREVRIRLVIRIHTYYFTGCGGHRFGRLEALHRPAIGTRRRIIRTESWKPFVVLGTDGRIDKNRQGHKKNHRVHLSTGSALKN